ncbi:MAG: hypothetical protein A49_22380 [Methyloceanibacter sp.]|nr:MAG: hypothetical protein A49_22380 [Methyloceanibacter sp.]
MIARPCIELLFEHGEFTAADTARVSRTLVAYSSGIWAYGLLHVLVRAFYALHDPVRPTMTATVMVFVNLALNLSLVWTLQEAGLGWATAICAALQCVWLAAILSRRLGGLDWRGVGRSLGKSLLATAVMSAGVLVAMRLMPTLESARMTALLLTAVPIAVGAGLYAATAGVMRSKEFGQLLRRSA